MPLQIYLAESGLSLDELVDRVNDQLRNNGRCLVVISEGFDAGSFAQRKDAFGHTQFSSSESTVEQIVVNHLNAVGLKARGAARGNVAGTDQRHAIAYASTIDLDEAYKVGQKAVLLASARSSGQMATILREPGLIYSVRYEHVPLDVVANSERTFPERWIDASRTDVTDEFVAYARPLLGEDWVSVPVVGGRQRFARLEPKFVTKRLPAYVPQAYRTKSPGR
jgi:6-phosphofructokinase 1